ncbi:UNVERIFIED_CONTAM: hypothetical protein Sradi_3444300 [Sesamum radiatum]|uniref:Uncharacterized protein n=1 Tax=Sesamum radiatum TaxID=300843 RepID=A0AAW2R5R4_SESRA
MPPPDPHPVFSQSESFISNSGPVDTRKRENGEMGKQSRSKKPEFVGKGKVTPVQVAFIVDRYLSDNSYTHTRSTFRSEASHLISKSPVQEAPKSLLSLGAILDEYITLKEQKVWVDQERCRLEQEKLRVQNLLSGMQDVLNAYNATGNNVVTPSPPLPPPTVVSGAMVSQADLAVVTPAAYFHMHNSPAMMSTSRPSNIRKDHTNFSTPVMSHATTKRKGPKDVSDAPVTSKRSRRCTQPKDVNSVIQSSNAEQKEQKSLMNSTTQSSARDNATNGSPVQGSNRSNTKDHVKGRLDFGTSEMPMMTENLTCDGNSTSESDKEGDILDLDFANLDALGLDFNFSEFLVDFDIDNEGLGLSSKQVVDSSPDSHSGSLPTSGNVELDTRQVTSQFSSTMTGFLGEKNMNLVGTDSVAAMRSVTKCIRIVSPGNLHPN